MKFDAIYYEPDSLNYPLGKRLMEMYGELPRFPIESHNSIKEMQEKPNEQFRQMKRNLIIGIRKTHRYVENHKVSDYLVPYTSSGCTAMCLYCYLVCNYNKCAYLRLFVNRMCDAGYPCGLLIAPVILTEGWKPMYTRLLEELRDGLSEAMKKQMFLEIILMTYSYVHRAINGDAFPDAPELYDRALMTGRGRGRYCYRSEARAEAEAFLRAQIQKILGDVPILYIS